MQEGTNAPQIPFEFLPKTDQAEAIAQCGSDSCKEAKERLFKARDEIAIQCGATKVAKEIADRLDGWAKFLWGVTAAFAAAAVAAAATGIGIFWAIILAGLAALALIAAAILTGLATRAATRYGEAASRLSKAQSDFSSIAAEVRQNCSEYCWPDLSMPQCE